jgi:hypothetical protein
MQKYTAKEIKEAKAMKAKELYKDLKLLFSRYEAYQDDILGLKTLAVMIRLIEGAVKPEDYPLKSKYILTLKEIDQFSKGKSKEIDIMMVIVKK